MSFDYLLDDRSALLAVTAALIGLVFLVGVIDTWVRVELLPRHPRPPVRPQRGSTAEWAAGRGWPPPPAGRAERHARMLADEVDRLRVERAGLAAANHQLADRLATANREIAVLESRRPLPELGTGDGFDQVRARRCAHTGPQAVDELFAELGLAA